RTSPPAPWPRARCWWSTSPPRARASKARPTGVPRLRPRTSTPRRRRTAPWRPHRPTGTLRPPRWAWGLPWRSTCSPQRSCCAAPPHVADPRPGAAPRSRDGVRFAAVLPATLAALVGTVAVSLFLGSNHLGPGELWAVMWQPDDSVASTVLHEQRMPRAL